MKGDVKEFLSGLHDLTRTTGIAVSGCGCCGSPYLLPATGTYRREGMSIIFDKVSSTETPDDPNSMEIMVLHKKIEESVVALKHLLYADNQSNAYDMLDAIHDMLLTQKNKLEPFV